MSTAEVRDAIEKIAKVLSEHPQKGRSRSPPATAALETGLWFRIVGPNGEAAVSDMPPPLGGEGSAPAPGWLLRASLASCHATVIAMRAAQLGITLTTLEVAVTSESDVRGLLGIDERVSAGLVGLRTHVEIGAAGASPEQLRQIVSWAEAHSPIGCTVRDPQTTAVEVEVV
ncbi:MAG: OsmC family protein [Candidatus Rokuibacteriota bacterium]